MGRLDNRTMSEKKTSIAAKKKTRGIPAKLMAGSLELKEKHEKDSAIARVETTIALQKKVVASIAKRRARIEDRLNGLREKYGEEIPYLPEMTNGSLDELEEELRTMADEGSKQIALVRQIRRNAGLTNWQRVQLARMTNGVTPLAILISIAADEGEDIDNRIKAATAAAPYVHKKMPTVIEGGDKPIKFVGMTLDPASLSQLPDEQLFAMVEMLREQGLVVSEQ
jgi:hypothetical protein